MDIKKVIVSTFMFITFGLGSLPEAPLDGGLIIVGFSEKKPKEVPIISQHGIVLFTIEM
jgi:hypothetical protein